MFLTATFKIRDLNCSNLTIYKSFNHTDYLLCKTEKGNFFNTFKKKYVILIGIAFEMFRNKLAVNPLSMSAYQIIQPWTIFQSRTLLGGSQLSHSQLFKPELNQASYD